jgi:NADH-quinone oxidoreductase subunit C
VNWREQVVAATTAVLGAEPVADDTFGPLAVDVPTEHWTAAVRVLRDDCGATYLDWLSAVDELADGFRVVVHLARLGTPVEHVLVRTRVPRGEPVLASLVPVFAGAAWHERETYEMFGIDFTGGAELDTLLLPEEFEGHPLRKDFVLVSRVAKPWPGAKDPGESDSTLSTAAPSRRKTLPPGVPEPAAWGPREPGSPAPDPLAAVAPSGPAARPRRGRAAAPPGVNPEPGAQPPGGSAAPDDVASQPSAADGAAADTSTPEPRDG